MTSFSNDRHSWSRRTLMGLGCGLVGGITIVKPRSAVAVDAGEIIQPALATQQEYIKRAFTMRDLALSEGDQGYGAVIVKIASKQIVGQSPSRVVTRGDPTGHAEMEAIRDATRRLGTRDLSGHAMYSSSRPCPMCEAAAYWAHLDVLYFGADATDGGAPRLCCKG